MRCSPRLLVCFVTLIAVGSLAPPAIAYKYGWSVRAAGTTAVTFDSSETCNPNGDWIDEPVRVFRYRNTESPSPPGKPKVQGTWARHPASKRMIGDDLYSLKRESTLAITDPKYRGCTGGNDAVYRGHSKNPTVPYPGSYPPVDPGPGTYQNSEWLESPYIKDGKVYALIHNEFHGGNFPGWCVYRAPPLPPTNPTAECWYTAVTMAVSDPAVAPEDSGGVTSPFDKIGSWYVPPSDYLVATIPYRYEINDANEPIAGRNGYGAMTNIIKGERQENGQDAYYFLVNVSAPRLPQKAGICLMRTTNLASASAWRAWDGDGFDATVNSNPYSADPPPSQAGHICEPVFSGMQVRNITYNRELEKYMVVGTHPDPNVRSAKYALSDDLINWSPLQVIFEEEPGIPGITCPDPRAGYPALLDPDDPAQSTDPDTGANTNFDHPDRMTDIFHRRPEQGPPPDCAPAGPGPNGEGSDLVHTPLELKQRLTTVSGSSLEEQPSGFDAAQGQFVSQINAPDYDPDPLPNKYAHAVTWAGVSTFGYGRLGWRGVGTPLEWNDGDDVWYGTAFNLPSTFLTDNTSPHLMRWETATGQYGGIQLRPSDKLQLIRSPGNTPVVSAEFTPPVGRWFWIEVHQKLGTSSGGGTLNEVYIDGKLVGTSTDANRGDSAPVKRVNYGFVTNNLPNGLSSIAIDRSSILGAQRGAVIGSGDFRAARTPIGVRASTPGSGQLRLDWNGPGAGDPPVTGYRIYELTGETWDPVNVDQTSSLNITKSGLTPCSTHTYRITAYRSFPDPNPSNPTTESLPTTPVTAEAGC